MTWHDDISDKTMGIVAGINIMAEHRRQIAKHGHQDVSPEEWMLYLTEEVGELAAAINDHRYTNGPKESIPKEAIQVATLAIKIAIMGGR